MINFNWSKRMKTKTQKRVEAFERLKNSKYENSKACRTGSATQETWEANKQKHLG